MTCSIRKTGEQSSLSKTEVFRDSLYKIRYMFTYTGDSKNMKPPGCKYIVSY